MARTHEGWNKAKDIMGLHKQHMGEKYNEYMKNLTFVEVSQEAYHDLTLFVDTDGNYWYDRNYIGD